MILAHVAWVFWFATRAANHIWSLIWLKTILTKKARKLKDHGGLPLFWFGHIAYLSFCTNVQIKALAVIKSQTDFLLGPFLWNCDETHYANQHGQFPHLLCLIWDPTFLTVWCWNVNEFALLLKASQPSEHRVLFKVIQYHTWDVKLIL